MNLDWIRAYMGDEGLDAVIPVNLQTAAYASGAHNPLSMHWQDQELPSFTVFPRVGDPFAVMGNAKWLEGSRRPWWINEVYQGGWRTSEAVERLAVILRERGLDQATLGLDLESAPVSLVNELHRHLPAIQVRDASLLFHQLRAVKTEKEVGFHQKALAALETAVEEMRSNLKAGRLVSDLMRRFRELVTVEGGAEFDGADLNPVLPDGSKGEAIHAHTLSTEWFDPPTVSEQTIEPGRVLTMDLISSYQGYHADVRANLCLGEPENGMAQCCDLDAAVYHILCSNVRPGVSTSECHALCREEIEKAGYTRYWSIHGIGLTVHEEPMLGNRQTPRPEMQFEVGNVLSIESQFHESMYVLREDGLQRLGSLPPGVMSA